MPLARINNGANTEPKKKRAKTEKKVVTKSKSRSNVAAVQLNESTTSSTENDESLAINEEALPTPTGTAKSSLSNSTDSISSKLAATTTNDSQESDDKKTEEGNLDSK
jgi:hypothetical protein